MINIITEKSILEMPIDTATEGRIQGLLGVHTSPFHADDVFAVAALAIIWPNFQVVQTRNPVVLARCEIVVDVGGVYDPDILRFDHHQKGGAGTRNNHVPYASIGLIWKHFALKIISTIVPANKLLDVKRVAAAVDRSLIQSLDAIDNGYNGPGENVYTVSRAISSYNPAWNDDQPPQVWEVQFAEAVQMARTILWNEIRRQAADVAAITTIEEALENRAHDHLLILDRFMPWQNTVLSSENADDVEFVIFPDKGGDYRLVTVPISKDDMFTPRKPLPASWAGLEGAALEQACGVEGATFCHNGRFVAGAKNYIGVLQMSLKAHEEGLVPS